MKRLVLTTFASALCAISALSMPTQAELKKAQPLVVELMADDMAAFKTKSKKAEEVGDTSVKYAQEASTEAAKFLLLKGAISYYVRGEAYDKAADAVNALRTGVADVPPEVVEEIIRKSTARVTAKKAPRLFAQYRVAQVQVAAAKEISASKAALGKKPNDAELMRKLAEAQALSGDWKAALDTFAKQGNKAGATAKAESEGKTLPDVADFWWAYESYLGEEDADIFKMHAAEIYRKCLADGSIDGLKKNIVEKRLKQIVVENVAKGAAAKKGFENFAIDIGSGEKIEFVACPAGTFTMGYEDKQGSYQKHKVTISRPFWISKYLITIDQWRMLMGRDDPFLQGQKDRNEPLLRDMIGGGKTPVCGRVQDYEEFMVKLSKWNKHGLPKGYVFRFPTEAEWEYACKANDRPDSPYCKMNWSPEEFEKICVPAGKRFIMLEQKGCPKECLDKMRTWLWGLPPMSVGGCRPNAWNLYDMVGRHQYTLDTVAMRKLPWPNFKEVDLSYDTVSIAVDPLHVCEEGEPARVVCGDGLHGFEFKGRTYNLFKALAEGVKRPLSEMSLRICIGPDLVSEWRAKHGKK